MIFFKEIVLNFLEQNYSNSLVESLICIDLEQVHLKFRGVKLAWKSAQIAVKKGPI